MHDVQALGTIGRGHDLEALQLEIDPDQLPDDLVVVDNKHPAGRAWHNSRVGRPAAAASGFCPLPTPCGGLPTADDGPSPKSDHRPTPAPPPKPVHGHPAELVVFYPSPHNTADTPP